MKVDDIKSCPFCGGEPFLQTKWSAGKQTTFLFMKCKTCGSTGKTFASDFFIEKKEDLFKNEDLTSCAEMAIEAWNRRVEK